MRVLLLLLLAGCASQAQIEQREAYERQQREAQRTARMEARCQQLGFTPGSPDFRQCMLALHQSLMQQDAADRAVILQHMLQQRR